MAKETKAELLKKNVEPDISKENMTSVNNTVEQDTHITRTPKIKPTPYVLDETMETETELPKKNSTEDKDTQNEEDTHTQTIPKAPVKPTLYEPERDPNELTITIRKAMMQQMPQQLAQEPTTLCLTQCEYPESLTTSTSWTNQ